MTINTDLFESLLQSITNKTIAIVYIFENEDSPGYEHYDIWKGDVISEWLNAIQQLKCTPYILDLKTFINQAMNKTLPDIDVVINLNNGTTVLSTLSLVPSVCSFLDIPCIPCNAEAIIAGENKYFANSIARTNELILPNNSTVSGETIFRPFNYGSSHGVVRNATSISDQGINQEFIKGYDITTPILFNPVTSELEVLPTIMYYPENKDVNWFFNAQVKETRGGYKKAILKVDEETCSKFIKLAISLKINTYCRIDSRIKCNSADEWDALFLSPIDFNKIHFIEINPMPTLKQNINFYNSIEALDKSNPIHSLYELFKTNIGNSSPIGFILFCSLLRLKPRIEEKRI